MLSTKQVQALLIYHGFNPGNPDGIMGLKTRTAIKQFQTAVNQSQTSKIAVDGVVGPVTEKYLKNLDATYTLVSNSLSSQATSPSTSAVGGATKFVPRLTRPTAGNKYYITRSKGGYSNAIVGKPTDPQCNVLANCVGYAYGRFNEIGGWGSCKYLQPCNAENFIQNCGGLQVGQVPKIGACAVWRKGATLGGSDGAGHVAIVEQVISPTQIVTSESGYNCATPFWTKTRNKGADGNWGAGAGYTFLGFIYNPAPCCK